MIRHFFLDKTNTIMKGSKANLGLNPILKINYGNDLTRGLIHFDDSELRKLYENKEIDPLLSTFRLKMTNCMSVDGLPYEKELTRSGLAIGSRACSFDLLLFELPQEFDAGRGFDFSSDFWIRGGKSTTTEGSNWYFAKSGIVWEDDREKLDLNDKSLDWDTLSNLEKGAEVVSVRDGLYTAEEIERQYERFLKGKESIFQRKKVDRVRKIDIEGGVYTDKTIKQEYEKFLNGEKSIFIGSQHFDFGMENLDIDITEYVREMLTKDKPNYGFGIMFAPAFENMALDYSQYVGFFSNNTNTFFHPYVEMHCANEVNDDRDDFTMGKENKLFFFAEVDGEPVEFDELPVCTIEEKEYPVTMLKKGCYYALIDDLEGEVEDESIMYDEWSNLALNGVKMKPVEMEFEVHASAYRMSIGRAKTGKPDIVPSISGINDEERILRSDVKTINIEFREKFSTENKFPSSNVTYRIYTKDGKLNREYTVIDFAPTERTFFYNFFKIYGMDLIPNDYFIDIRLENAQGIKTYREIAKFTVVSDVTERYE